VNPSDSFNGYTVTRLLDAWRAGDARAGDALFAVVYDDLRTLARRQLSRLRVGQTLAPTALVHEAYMKFSARSAPNVVDRSHFLSVAARAMRHVVVDYVRRNQSDKRNPGAPVMALDGDVVAADGISPVDLIAMDQALGQLDILDPRQARIVELRFFGGLELEEIATELGISSRTVKRDWRNARAFLSRVLSPVP
jgi:RNA polymerase sigma factor (TIGR02999 family)